MGTISQKKFSEISNSNLKKKWYIKREGYSNPKNDHHVLLAHLETKK